MFCLIHGHDLELDVDQAEVMVVGAATGAHEVSALAALVAKALRQA